MAPMIPELSNMLALTCGAGAVVIVAITLVALLIRQLGWFAYDGQNKERE